MISIKVSRKGRPFTSKLLKQATAKALDGEAQTVKREYEKTVSTWKNKPQFIVEKTSVQARAIRLAKGRKASQIYGYVDEGTKAHVIRPKRAKVLAFKVPSMPKTTPNFIGSGPGGRGDKPVFALAVRHPGTKPRNFTKIIQRASLKRFPRLLEKEIARVAK